MGNDIFKKRASGNLLAKEIAVLKANSNLSEAEIRGMYKDFHKESPSGKMDKNQFVKFYMHIAKSQDMRAMPEHFFALFDKNGDGTVDFSEFVLATALLSKKDIDSQIELAFEMIDTSADEHISYEELVKFLEISINLAIKDGSVPPNPHRVANGIFHKLGTDKEQKLSRQQFIEGCKNSEELSQCFVS